MYLLKTDTWYLERIILLMGGILYWQAVSLPGSIAPAGLY